MTKKKLSPIVSEFETEEEAEAYDAWFRRKVQRAIDNPGHLIPHDEAMKHARETIKRRSASSDHERSTGPRDYSKHSYQPASLAGA